MNSDDKLILKHFMINGKMDFETQIAKLNMK